VSEEPYEPSDLHKDSPLGPSPAQATPTQTSPAESGAECQNKSMTQEIGLPRD
jgi:hypothetical protein